MRERVNRQAEAVRGDGPAAALRPAEAGRIWGARSSTGQVVAAVPQGASQGAVGGDSVFVRERTNACANGVGALAGI